MIDNTAETYVPAVSGTFGAKIRELLPTASGNHLAEDYGSTDDATRMMAGLFARPGKPAAEILRQFNDRDAPPGTLFHYAGSETETLGLVVADTIGETLSGYLQSRLWSRIGTESDARWMIDSNRQEVAPLLLQRDLARLRPPRPPARPGRPVGRARDRAQAMADRRDHCCPGRRFPGAGNDEPRHRLRLPSLATEKPAPMFTLVGIHGQQVLVDL